MGELLTPEIRSWIGRSEPPVRIEVTRRDIVKYAIATGQRLERYRRGDEAPPMFLYGAQQPLTEIDALGPDGIRVDTLIPELPLHRVMAGGVSQTHRRPVRPGDSLILTRTLSDIYEKRGSSGPLIFVVYTTRIETDDGEPVLEQVQTRIVR